MLAIGQRLEFDQKIHVASVGIETFSDRGAKEIQPPHAVAAAKLRDLTPMLGNRGVHIKMVAHFVAVVKMRFGTGNRMPCVGLLFEAPRLVQAIPMDTSRSAIDAM